jgi:hypothetical protein
MKHCRYKKKQHDEFFVDDEAIEVHTLTYRDYVYTVNDVNHSDSLLLS